MDREPTNAPVDFNRLRAAGHANIAAGLEGISYEPPTNPSAAGSTS
ncbi:hypothetical protein JCM4814A_92470 [Streptomyces phaeofaciens JCM 4814]|uniref:Uncharacterized protein n=1 Tax=Streptomyces phaeofaciens TaxID=68254 RepID=A0A918HJ81_9ACTN|nr:hypothetical protein [Streptomyces phaeofaciens]GGT70749.1 hypothetical protein GCM10010226_55810 [Streptomyces phaeofaciens]